MSRGGFIVKVLVLSTLIVLSSIASVVSFAATGYLKGGS